MTILDKYINSALFDRPALPKYPSYRLKPPALNIRPIEIRILSATFILDEARHVRVQVVEISVLAKSGQKEKACETAARTAKKIVSLRRDAEKVPVNTKEEAKILTEAVMYIEDSAAEIVLLNKEFGLGLSKELLLELSAGRGPLLIKEPPAEKKEGVSPGKESVKEHSFDRLSKSPAVQLIIERQERENEEAKRLMDRAAKRIAEELKEAEKLTERKLAKAFYKKLMNSILLSGY